MSEWRFCINRFSYQPVCLPRGKQFMKNQLSITQIFISHARNDYALANALVRVVFPVPGGP